MFLHNSVQTTALKVLPAAARRRQPLMEEVAGDGLSRGPRDDASQQVVLGGAQNIVLFVLLIVQDSNGFPK